MKPQTQVIRKIFCIFVCFTVINYIWSSVWEPRVQFFRSNNQQEESEISAHNTSSTAQKQWRPAYSSSRPNQIRCKETLYTVKHLCGCDFWMLQTSTAWFRNISTWMKMFSKCITFPFPPAPPWLSSGVGCAVSVDLWYRSQDPPLTAHLYLCWHKVQEERSSSLWGWQAREREGENGGRD